MFVCWVSFVLRLDRFGGASHRARAVCYRFSGVRAFAPVLHDECGSTHPLPTRDNDFETFPKTTNMPLPLEKTKPTFCRKNCTRYNVQALRDTTQETFYFGPSSTVLKKKRKKKNAPCFVQNSS